MNGAPEPLAYGGLHDRSASLRPAIPFNPSPTLVPVPMAVVGNRQPYRRAPSCSLRPSPMPAREEPRSALCA